MDAILTQLLSNPKLGVAVVILAFLVCKAMKIAGKAFKIIIAVAIAYAIINFTGIFG